MSCYEYFSESIHLFNNRNNSTGNQSLDWRLGVQTRVKPWSWPLREEPTQGEWL